MSITSSAAATCCEVGLCFPLRTWLRIWPSRSSAIRLFMAPLAALITSRTSEQSRSSLRVRTRASTCPRIRLARRTSFSLSLIVWLIGLLALLLFHNTIPYLVWYSQLHDLQQPSEVLQTRGLPLSGLR